MDTAQDLFNPAPTPQEFQAPAGDKFFVGQDGQRAMLGSEEGVQAEFYEDSRKLELASKEAGLPLHKNQLYVRIKCKYDTKNIHVHLVQDGEEDEFKIRFRREYEQYLRAKEYSAIGMPVMTWQEIAPQEKATLEAIGVLTLEQLVAADDVMLAKIFKNVKKVKELALAQLNFKNKIADIGEVTKKLVASKAEIEEKDELIARLKAEKEAMQDAIRAVKNKSVTKPAIKRVEPMRLSPADITAAAEAQDLPGEEPVE